MKDMYKLIIFLGLFIISIFGNSQELIANVSVDYSQVQGSNNQVYKTLEKTLKEFINNTQWTSDKYKPEEKIECSFTILIKEKTGNDSFSASLIVQSRRPVYNSNYYTPILNIPDNDFKFRYAEFETLVFNERKFSGKNLTDMLAFYAYLIIGYDKDTFTRNGGTNAFNIAKKIAGNSENNGYQGWGIFDNANSRGNLINSILKPDGNTLRSIYYSYHLQGLDKFHNQELAAKNTILSAIKKLKVYENKSLFYPLEIFISAKKDEISDMLSGGLPTTTNISEIKNILETIAPKYSKDNWSKIKK